MAKRNLRCRTARRSTRIENGVHIVQQRIGGFLNKKVLLNRFALTTMRHECLIVFVLHSILIGAEVRITIPNDQVRQSEPAKVGLIIWLEATSIGLLKIHSEHDLMR